MTAASGNVELHPAVVGVAKSFEIKDGRLVMSSPAVESCVANLARVPVDEREEVGNQLVMIALRMKKEGGDAALGGVAVVVALVVELLGEGEGKKVADMFGAAGMADDVARVTGASQQTVIPAAEPTKPPPPTVKAKRGLKRD